MRAAKRTRLVDVTPTAEHAYVYPPRDGVTLRCRKHANCTPILLVAFPELTLARLRDRGELVEVG